MTPLLDTYPLWKRLRHQRNSPQSRKCFLSIQSSSISIIFGSRPPPWQVFIVGESPSLEYILPHWGDAQLLLVTMLNNSITSVFIHLKYCRKLPYKHIVHSYLVISGQKCPTYVIYNFHIPQQPFAPCRSSGSPGW